LVEKEARLSEMEKKVKEAEDKSKKTERTLKENKDRINDLEKEVIFVLKNSFLTLKIHLNFKNGLFSLDNMLIYSLLSRLRMKSQRFG
jgi:hypothetical protein